MCRKEPLLETTRVEEWPLSEPASQRVHAHYRPEVAWLLRVGSRGSAYGETEIKLTFNG